MTTVTDFQIRTSTDQHLVRLWDISIIGLNGNWIAMMRDRQNLSKLSLENRFIDFEILIFKETFTQ
jgi:hypothetical protein